MGLVSYTRGAGLIGPRRRSAATTRTRCSRDASPGAAARLTYANREDRQADVALSPTQPCWANDCLLPDLHIPTSSRPPLLEFEENTMTANHHITRPLATERVAELQREAMTARARRSPSATERRSARQPRSRRQGSAPRRSGGSVGARAGVPEADGPPDRPVASLGASARRSDGRWEHPSRALPADPKLSPHVSALDLQTHSRHPHVPGQRPPSWVDRHAEPRRPAGRLSDEDLTRLVHSAAAGDQGAWEVLVHEFDRMLRRIARAHRLHDSDAADVAQATWLKLFEHLVDLKEPTRVGGWLATTARRECLRVLHASARLDLVAPHQTPDRECLDSRPADALLARERDEAVRHSLARLRARDQRLLQLLMGDPRPDYHRIARVLDMPIGSIGPTRARALERLRAELESAGTLASIAA